MTEQVTVGAFEAKTHLSALLERVERGEQITITRHGKPIAKLVPSAPVINRRKVSRAIAQIKKLRKGSRLDGLSWKKLRDEGRK